MLHILWVIIKWILILLGVLLGLLLFALLLVLFCPLRYQAEAKKAEADPWKNTEGRARITWLMKAIALQAVRSGGEFSFSVYLFGIPLERFKRKKKDRSSEDVEETARFSKEDRQEKREETYAGETAETEAEVKIEAKTEADAKVKSETEAKVEAEIKADPSSLDKSETQPQKYTTSAEHTKETYKETQKDSYEEDSYEFFDEKPKTQDKIAGIRLTLNKIRDKIGWWKDYLGNPKIQAAITCVKKETWMLLRHIAPTNLTGDVVFGNEDPSVTGKILAVLGMTIPLHKNRVQVHPLFDGSNTMYGRVAMKGRIYGVVLVKIAADLWFDKNIKYAFQKWKQKEG